MTDLLLPTVVPTDRPGCRLRPWRADDKAQLLRIADNRNVWRNLTDLFPHPYTEADAEQWVLHAGTPSASLHLAIEAEGALAGGIGVIAGEGIARRTGQFGYWLGEPFWGRGIATAAARAMVAHLIAARAFVRLEAPVFAWNPASMAVLEKCGFIREGVLHSSVFKDGQLIDSVMYARVH